MLDCQSIINFHRTDRILFRGSDYIYLYPHASLRQWISHYCITFPHPGMMSEQYTIMPHGATTLVFSVDSSAITSTLFGPITTPVNVGHNINTYSLLFIIEFEPAGYYAFNNVPQKELANLIQPIDDIDPALHRLILDHLEFEIDINVFVDAINHLFINYVKTSKYQQEFLLANQMIIKNDGTLPVNELSHELYYSERHLNRLFDKYLGASMKSYSRLVRVNKAIYLLGRKSLSMQEVCMDAGFYDLPHFIQDFKLICGVTPQEYRDNMSDFYSRITKY